MVKYLTVVSSLGFFSSYCLKKPEFKGMLLGSDNENARIICALQIFASKAKEGAEYLPERVLLRILRVQR